MMAASAATRTTCTTTLSHKAEIFQSKLIEGFQLLETVSEQGRKRAPVYSSSDILGITTIQQLKSVSKL